MKTILKCKWAVGLCLATLLMAACSTEETNVPPLAENESSKLISALEIVNQQLMGDTAKVQTRSWGQWQLGRKADIISADWNGCRRGYNVGKTIGGFFGIEGRKYGIIIGCVVGGSYSSLKKWNDMNKKYECNDNDEDFDGVLEMCRTLAVKGCITDEGIIDEVVLDPNENLLPNDELVLMSNLDEQSLMVGKMHNVILASLANSNDDLILDEKPEKLPNQKVSADIELQLTILDSEDLQTECKTIARDIINGQGDNNNSTVDKILELFEDVLKQYPEESRDVAFVIGKYTEIIDQSDELTEEEKMVLKSTFATALCSSKYWEDNMQ